MSEFDLFWSVYPIKRDRLAAMREYIHARRLVSAQTILQGAEQYRVHCEHERTEAKYIQKPTTWLRNGGWDNEYDEPVVRERYTWNCQHTPPCGNRTWCDVLTEKAQKAKGA